MKNQKISMMMASAALFGASMAGCTGASLDRPKLTAGDAQPLAPKIERMLGDKDVEPALALAERLVSADPQNANARALLGRAYLANGRYLSARTAFNDAMTLGNRDPRTIVSLALCEAGLGNLDGARKLLSDHIADLPAGDYGLAMAMTGDPREGVRALLEAVRAPDATSKTRQNLAYALVMAGAWGQARLIAGQDLTARDAEARIGEWSRSVAQTNESERVVAMLGVSPRGDDSGLPVSLALNQAPSTQEQPVELASAAELSHNESAVAPVHTVPQAEAAAVQTAAAETPKPAFAPNALATILAKLPDASGPAAHDTAAKAFAAPTAPAAVQMDSTPAPAVLAAAFSPSPAAAPAAQPMAKPVAPVVQAAFRQKAEASAAPRGSRSNWTAGLGAPVADARASDWVVQLGALNSPAVARDKWQQITAGRQELKSYGTIYSQFVVNGRTFHRLAIRGFEGRSAAASACSTLRSAGQPCFVRLDDTRTTHQARADALQQDPALASAQPAGRSRPAR